MAPRVPFSKIAPEGGGYRIVLRSGALTGIVAANSPVFSFQWTSTTLRCCVQRLRWAAEIETAAGAAQNLDFGLYVANPYTVADTGGLAATLTTINAKLDQNFPLTAMGDMRIADGAMLTAGTRTLAAHPLAFSASWISNALIIGEPPKSADNWFGFTDALNPITLRAQQGLVLNNITAIGATTVIRLYVEMEWIEPDLGKT